MIVLRCSPPTLGRILEWMAQRSAPHHRDLIRGMVLELDSITDPAERRRFAIGAIVAICRLCFLSSYESILVEDKHSSFLKAAGLTRRLSIARKIEILSGLGMFLGFKMLNANHEALYGVFMFSGMALGVVGFWYELRAIRCPSCGASLTWHAFSKLSLGESESWLHRFEECPYCHFRPGTHAASPSTETTPPWNQTTPELSDLETGTAGPVLGRPPHGPQASRWRKFWWFWWPKIDGLAAAEDAKKSGYVLAVIMAVLIVYSPAVGPDHYSPLALILVVFWGAIAWGIRRANHVAAYAGLGLSLGTLVLTWPPTPDPTWVKALWALVLPLGFVKGIRGAFAVHKYRVDAGADGSASTAEP